MATNIQPNIQSIKAVETALQDMEKTPQALGFKGEITQFKLQLAAIREGVEKNDSPDTIADKVNAFKKTVSTVYKTSLRIISQTHQNENAQPQQQAPVVMTDENAADIHFQIYAQGLINKAQKKHDEYAQMLLLCYPMTCSALFDAIESIKKGAYGSDAKEALEDSAPMFLEVGFIMKLILVHYCQMKSEFSLPDILNACEKEKFQKLSKFIKTLETVNGFRFCRFFGLFEQIFFWFVGGYIRKLI